MGMFIDKNKHISTTPLRQCKRAQENILYKFSSYFAYTNHPFALLQPDEPNGRASKYTLYIYLV